MVNYDPNEIWGKHTVEITLQNWEFTGKVTRKVNGNCKGFNILESAKDFYEDDKYESNCNLKIENNWFYCTLRDKYGNTIDIEEELDCLEDYIVKLEIVNFEEE